MLHIELQIADNSCLFKMLPAHKDELSVDIQFNCCGNACGYIMVNTVFMISI